MRSSVEPSGNSGNIAAILRSSAASSGFVQRISSVCESTLIFSSFVSGRAHRGLDAQEGCAFGGGLHRLRPQRQRRSAVEHATCGHNAAEGAKDKDQKAVTGKDGRKRKFMEGMKTKRAES
jgi:hypothetical protein